MITMCDYYGMCDAEGRCVGHPVKVTKEYGQMLTDLGEKLRLVCSPCIADGACAPAGDQPSSGGVSADGSGDPGNYGSSLFTEIIRLPYNISIVGNGIFKRIVDKFKLFKNIRLSLKNKGTIFFYQVDFFFFLYLKLFYKVSDERKIVILIYHQEFTGGRVEPVLKRIYESALSKIDGVIYTQKNAKVPHDNALWMPDFVYQPDIYDEYRNRDKKDRIVCLGTMNRYKQIEALMELWAEQDIRKSEEGEDRKDEKRSLPELIIAGRFDDESRYEMLKRMVPSGVLLRDEVLSYDEYMTLLSGSKYSIMPYDMDQYKSRTSGVLLESIYCGVIPIAPGELLRQNGLPGIGYDKMSDIAELFGDGREVPAQSDADGHSIPVIESFGRVYEEYGKAQAVATIKRIICEA